METSVTPLRADVVAITSAPRPTPIPPQKRFSEVLAAGIVRGAETAITKLPGGPMLAAALRGNAFDGAHLGGGGVGVRLARPADGIAPVSPGLRDVLDSAPGAVVTGQASGGGIETSLAQSQEMNLYFLQIQEAVNAQNRAFTVTSNVLKAEHDTVKNAIGNIR